MDIKEKIEDIVSKAKNDEQFHKDLKSDPVKAVEELLGVDLPDEQVKAIVAGVKTKLNFDSASGTLGGIESKIEGFFHKK